MVIDGIATNIASQGLWEGGKLAAAKIKHRSFCKIFGKDVLAGRLFVIPGALIPPSVQMNGKPHPYIFQKSGKPTLGFSTSLAVPYCELRATKYVSDAVAETTGKVTQLMTDEDLADRLDLSFVSFGLMSNLKTMELIGNSSNNLVSFDGREFVSKHSGRSLGLRTSGAVDYGLIMKLHPANTAHRTWICCAGLGESGTSGAAWFLSRKWRELRKRFDDKAFAMLIKVTPGKDESSEEVVSGAPPACFERIIRP